MSPIDMSREIVESLTDNEYIRKKLHTIICHELTAEQIKELYNETKTLTKIKEGTGQMVLPLH